MSALKRLLADLTVTVLVFGPPAALVAAWFGLLTPADLELVGL